MPYFPKLPDARTTHINYAAFSDAQLLWHANYCCSELRNYYSDILAGLTDSLDHKSHQHVIATLKHVADAYAARNIRFVLNPADWTYLLLHNA